jgi:hypothetical protein
MMTRAAPESPILVSVLVPIILSFSALAALAFCVSFSGPTSKSVSLLLKCAQSEADARRFAELIGSLGEKPTVHRDQCGGLSISSPNPFVQITKRPSLEVSVGR